MDTNKSFIIMLILSVILVGVMWLYKPGEQKKPVQNNDVKEQVKSDKNASEKKDAAKSSASSDSGTSGDYALLEKAQDKKYDLSFDNNNMKILFDPNDAVIKHAWIKYTFLENGKDRSTDLVQPLKDSDGALRIKFGSWDNDKTLAALTGGKNFYNYERNGDVFTFKAALRKKSDNNIYNITKKYSILKDSNLLKLEIDMTNTKNQAFSFDNSSAAFSIGWGPLLGLESRDPNAQADQFSKFLYFNGNKPMGVTHSKNSITIEKTGAFGDKTVKANFAHEKMEANESWIANNNHYFVALLYPDKQNYEYFYDFRDFENKNFYCGLTRFTNNYTINSTFYVYIGPKIESVLKKYDNLKEDNFTLSNSNISSAEDSIFWGLGNWIGKFLEMIYRLVKNYGIAIIILTVIIKLLLSPLTHKSMVSQQKMTKLQPKIKELQEKFKGNPQQLQKETMELYRREKINPFSGCLPMLLQLPILYAMYQLLNGMVQLKGAEFLWIHDLAKPDSIYNFPGGFTIPLVGINSINVMPFIMTIVQIISSVMMQEGQSNKQANIMIWSMTIFMFVIFYNSSSGLVLYWTVMNILNLIQQFNLIRSKKKKENTSK